MQVFDDTRNWIKVIRTSKELGSSNYFYSRKVGKFNAFLFVFRHLLVTRVFQFTTTKNKQPFKLLKSCNYSGRFYRNGFVFLAWLQKKKKKKCTAAMSSNHVESKSYIFNLIQVCFFGQKFSIFNESISCPDYYLECI